MQILIDNDLYTIDLDLTKYKLVKNKNENQLRFYAIEDSEYTTLNSIVNFDLNELLIDVLALEYDTDQKKIKISTNNKKDIVNLGKRKIGDLMIIQTS